MVHPSSRGQLEFRNQTLPSASSGPPAWGPPRLKSHSQMPLWVDSKYLGGCCHPVATQGHGSPPERPGAAGQLPNSRGEPKILPSFFGSALPRYLVNGSYSPSSAALSQPSLEGSPAPFPGFPCAPWPQALTTSLPTSFYCASPFSSQVLILT